MPIRFIDRAQTNLVRVAAALEHAAASFIGTFTAAASRTGVIGAQLQDYAAALSGVVQANANRTGTITTTLADHAAAFRSPANTSLVLADYLARAGGPNVVWHHLFESEAELNAFRWMNGVGNDPTASGPSASNARVLVGQGPGGLNCLEFIYPAGVSQPVTFWWRPTAPMNTGSGKAQNDPAASGTLTVRTWNPSSSSSHLSNFTFGWYGHPTYANADPSHFDGNEIWFQVRLKADPRRITGGNEASEFGGGKFVWFTTAEGAQSLSGGEHVFWSYGRGGSAANQGADKNYLRCYVHQVTGIGAFDPLDQEEPGTRIQPGSDVAEDWYYTNGWDTVLYNIRLGQIGVTSGANSTRLRVFAARDGETEYTKIWEQEYGISSFEARNGLQAVILSPFNNGFDFPQEFYHRYAHPIFSKSWIPPPQVNDTSTNALIVAAAALAPSQSSSSLSTSGLTAAARGSIQWVNRGFYDHARKRWIVHGKYASDQSSPSGGRATMVYDAAANTWNSSAVFHINGVSNIGHVYESLAYDPKEQRLYSGRYTSAADSIYYWTYGAAYDSWGATAVTPWALNSNSTQPVLGWHPNLFGPGDGGLVVIRLVSGTTMQLVTWRRATDQWSANLVQSTAPSQHGAMTYVRHYDALFATHAGGNTYRINAGSGGVAATPIQIANPPIQCRHIGGGSSGGILIDDPKGLGGPYVLAKGTGTGTVYKYEGTSWTTKGYLHPYPTGATGNGTLWSVAPMFPLGVFGCLRDSTSTAPILWRPND